MTKPTWTPISSWVEVTGGRLRCEEFGDPSARSVVFVHGYLMDSRLWHPLARRVADLGLRAVTPTWPLGSQREAMSSGTDVTLSGVAHQVADLVAALDLRDAVLVGADTGGVVAQLVAVDHPDSIGALVLTSCDAFENFPPPILRPLLIASKIPLAAAFRLALLVQRIGPLRRRGFEPLSHHPVDHLARDWVRLSTRDGRVAGNLRELTASLTQETTLRAGARLGEFTKPALVAWSADDVFFPLKDGERLASSLPAAHYEVIDRARTFSMIDQTELLADLILATADRIR